MRCCKRDALLDVRDDHAFGDRLADFDHFFFEALAVFGELDRVDRRTEQFDAVLLEDTGVVQFDREIQSGLAAERRQKRIRAFARDDLFDRCDGKRLEVDRIGNLGIGHDRRRIRIDEDDAVAFFTKARHACTPA